MKSQGKVTKNRLFLDFSWLKAVFFNFTWLSFLQRVTDMVFSFFSGTTCSQVSPRMPHCPLDQCSHRAWRWCEWMHASGWCTEHCMQRCAGCLWAIFGLLHADATNRVGALPQAKLNDWHQFLPYLCQCGQNMGLCHIHCTRWLPMSLTPWYVFHPLVTMSLLRGSRREGSQHYYICQGLCTVLGF